MVAEFHTVFSHPVEAKPTVGDKRLRTLRVKLIAEELTELCEALGVDLEISCDEGRFEVVVEAALEDEEINLVEAADALGDIQYVVHGANLVFGLPGDEVFAEIHNSNMSKLGDDGKPIYREDDKILKGPNYFKPDIRSIVESKMV